eukprot:910787-Prymnesium_polylepis.2
MAVLARGCGGGAAGAKPPPNMGVSGGAGIASGIRTPGAGRLDERSAMLVAGGGGAGIEALSCRVFIIDAGKPFAPRFAPAYGMIVAPYAICGGTPKCCRELEFHERSVRS